MSTLNITTLQDRASSDNAPVLDAIHGSARAWVNFNGTGTVAIRAAYNVSSITDLGTGIFTVNFTSAMSDTNYSILATSNYSSSVAWTAAPRSGTSPLTTSFNITVVNLSGVADLTYNSIAVFR